MKKIQYLIFILSFVILFAASGCSGNANVDIPDKNLSFKLNGKEMNLPVAYDELKAAGFGFDEAVAGNIKEGTQIAGISTFSETYQTKDGALTFLYANLSNSKQNAEKCEAIGVDAVYYGTGDDVIKVEYKGITPESSLDDVKEALGNPGNEGKNGDYTLFEYNIGDDNHIALTFSEDKMMGFILSSEYPGINFKSVDE